MLICMKKSALFQDSLPGVNHYGFNPEVTFKRAVEFSFFCWVFFSGQAHLSTSKALAPTHGTLRKAPQHRPSWGRGTNHKLPRVDGRVGTVPSSDSVLTGRWQLVAGYGAEPMGRRRGTNGETSRSARERDRYKPWREIHSRFFVQGNTQLENDLVAFISSRLNMVRTKADSVPGTYRKGEATQHGSGGRGLLPHPPPPRAEEVGVVPHCGGKQRPGPLKRRKKLRGQGRVLDRGAFPRACVGDCGEDVVPRLLVVPF